MNMPESPSGATSPGSPSPDKSGAAPAGTASFPPTAPGPADKPPHAQGWKQLLAVVVLVALAAGGVYWWQSRAKTAGAAPMGFPPAAVSVAKPFQGQVIDWDEYTGYLAAIDSVKLHARVSGLIVAAHFEEGGLVQAGDVLYEIDPRPFQANLDARLAVVAQVQAQIQIDQLQYDKIADLVQRKAATEFERDTAAATLARTQAGLKEAQAAVELARLNLEWCHVTAPISGRIGRKLVTVGNLVTGGGGQDTLLTTLWSENPIYCDVDVDEESSLRYRRWWQESFPNTPMHELVKAAANTPVYLQLGRDKTFPYEGRLNFVDQRIDAGTGTQQVRAKFPNENGWLTPGLFARIRIRASKPYQALLVPDLALGANQNEHYVLVVDDQHQVEMRPVKLGRLYGRWQAISDGLKSGDLVIVDGMALARPGAPVQEKEVPLPPPDTALLLGDVNAAPTTQTSAAPGNTPAAAAGVAP